jgi:ubiquinone/menaquinone biosynthesis C-methylase UbiE
MKEKRSCNSHPPTSWEESAEWYDRIVGEKGHFYHEQLVFPKVLKLLDLTPGSRLVDLGCGQGAFSAVLPHEVTYLGLDISPALIGMAKKRFPKRQFLVHDVAQPLSEQGGKFSHASFILSLQNMQEPAHALSVASSLLSVGGKIALVLVHPCFRIPRQSSWGIDAPKKLQYRRIDRYLSPMEIPIYTHPSRGEASETTVSFHYPLSSVTKWLHTAGFSIEWMEEWASEKRSHGESARMENRARAEFPLFLTILGRKVV